MNQRFSAGLTGRAWRLVPVLFVFVVSFLMSAAFGQETTGGLQGTVKDPTGAVVSKATVELTGAALVGVKSLETDGSGYFRFANLPPGSYTLKVTAQGFTAVRRDGIRVEVGRLPTLDLQLQVGASSTVVEVTGEAPLIDTTTSRTITNITPDVVAEVPHGVSFQSVIQFAPSARNEPLAGNNTVAGTGAGAMTRPGTGGGSPTFRHAGIDVCVCNIDRRATANDVGRSFLRANRLWIECSQGCISLGAAAGQRREFDLISRD